VQKAPDCQASNGKTGKALKQVDNFRYLGSVIHAHGGSEEDIKARIVAAWKMERVIRSVV